MLAPRAARSGLTPLSQVAGARLCTPPSRLFSRLPNEVT